MTNKRNESGTYSVTLPVDHEQLTQFISDLLGKPQTISRTIRGPFEVRKHDIADLHELLKQRISAQNESAPASFTAKIVYDDASSIQLNTFLEFQTYNEVRPLRSRQLHISWVYLVKFHGREIYEKQQIDLSIAIGSSSRSIEFDREIAQQLILGRVRSGMINLRVHHTDRTWGADIDSLLSGRLEHLHRKQSNARKFFSKYSTWFGWAVGLAILGMGLWMTFYTSSKIDTQYSDALSKLEKLPISIETLSQKISLLSKFVANGFFGTYSIISGFFIIATIIGAAIAGLMIESAADSSPKNFLILTRKDEEDQVLAIEAEGRDFVHFLLSVPGALALGILGNYLFYLLSKVFSLNA